MSEENEEIETEDNPRADLEAAIEDAGGLEEPVEEVDEEVTAEKVESQEPHDLKTFDKDGKEEVTPHKTPKAPLGWSPKAREQWNGVNQEVQREILAREKHMEETMANTSDARKAHEWFGNLAQSYAPVMAAEGIKDPYQAVKGLFDTVATLRMGSPEQKAKKIADMIGEYSIDIGALDNLLVGNQAEPSQNSQFEHMINERMQPINNLMEQLRQNQTQTENTNYANAQQSVADFEQNAEFLNDVRGDMADLLDMAAKNGTDMTLEQAYAKACALNPQVSEIMSKREEDARITGQRTTLAEKRRAASSLNGKQSGGGGVNEALSMRDTIAAAWDENGRD